MFSGFCVPGAVCNQDPMFIMCYIPKTLCSQGPNFSRVRQQIFQDSYVSICYQSPMFQHGPIIPSFHIHGSDVSRVQCPQVSSFLWSFASMALGPWPSRVLSTQSPMSLLSYITSVPCLEVPILSEFSEANFLKILFTWSPCCFNVPLTWKKTAIKCEIFETVFKLWQIFFATKGCFETQPLVTPLTPTKTLFTSVGALRPQKTLLHHLSHKLATLSLLIFLAKLPELVMSLHSMLIQI